MEALNLMTLDVTTIGSDLSLEEAHRLMLKLTARHLPVVANGKLVGMLSDRDVLLQVTRRGEEFIYPKLKVAEVMSPFPISAGVHTPVRELAKVMLEHKIDAVPIVSKDDEVVGLVTSSDLLRMVSQQKAA